MTARAAKADHAAADHAAADAAAPERPRDDPDSAYMRAPGYRRGPFASGVLIAYLTTWFLWFVLPVAALGNFVAWLGVVWVCGLVLTGPIYYNRYDDDGEVATWRRGNKVAAVLFLAMSTAMIAWSLM